MQLATDLGCHQFVADPGTSSEWVLANATSHQKTSPSTCSTSSPDDEEKSGDNDNGQSTETLTPSVGSKPWPWPNPNPNGAPRYSRPSNNVFLALESQPLENRSFDPEDEIHFLKPLPPPDDLAVTDCDGRYMSFFLREAPNFMGCSCALPEIVNIFTQSTNTPIIRYSILALSAAIQLTRSHTPGNAYTLRNVNRITPQIKRAISQVKINDSHLVSVTFLAWVALTVGKSSAAHHHLRGLFSMLKLNRFLSKTGSPVNGTSNQLVMLLFRLAVKVDNVLGYRNFPLVFPPLKYDETQTREWLGRIIASDEHLNYGLAAIQLDDYTNNLCHLQHETVHLRRLGCTNLNWDFQARLLSLKYELSIWPYRPYIRQHIVYPVSSPAVWREKPCESALIGGQFLSYPKYIVSDPIVAYMHMAHAGLVIHLNMLMSPSPKIPTNPMESPFWGDEAFYAAILLCRIHSALNALRGDTRGISANAHTTLVNLWLAGCAFARHSSSYEGTSSRL
jgi:hypothetical protein